MLWWVFHVFHKFSTGLVGMKTTPNRTIYSPIKNLKIHSV